MNKSGDFVKMHHFANLHISFQCRHGFEIKVTAAVATTAATAAAVVERVA